jgi:hypothetical protein
MREETWHGHWSSLVTKMVGAVSTSMGGLAVVLLAGDEVYVS